MAALDKVRELMRFKRSGKTDVITSRQLFIKENKVIRKMNVDDILRIEAKADYMQFTLSDKTYLVHGRLKTIEQTLSSKKNARVHRSFIIAVDKVECIENRLIHINNHPIPVSESYGHAFVAPAAIIKHRS